MTKVESGKTNGPFDGRVPDLGSRPNQTTSTQRTDTDTYPFGYFQPYVPGDNLTVRFEPLRETVGSGRIIATFRGIQTVEDPNYQVGSTVSIPPDMPVTMEGYRRRKIPLSK